MKLCFKLDGVHRDMESDDEEQTEVQRLLSDITDISFVKFHLQKEKKVLFNFLKFFSSSFFNFIILTF